MDAIVTPVDEVTSRFHIISREPFVVHVFDVKTATGIPTRHAQMDLSPVFRYNWSGTLVMARNPKNQQRPVIFDERTGMLVLVDPAGSFIEAIELKKLLLKKAAVEGDGPLGFFSRDQDKAARVTLVPEGTYDPVTKSGHLVFYTVGGQTLGIYTGDRLLRAQFPHGAIQEISHAAYGRWLVRTQNSKFYSVTFDDATGQLMVTGGFAQQQPRGTEMVADFLTEARPGVYSLTSTAEAMFGQVLEAKDLAEGKAVTSRGYPRPEDSKSGLTTLGSRHPTAAPASQLLHFLASPERKAFLEAVDLGQGGYRRIPVYDGKTQVLPEGAVLLRELGQDITLGLIGEGTVISWQLNPETLGAAAREWRQFFGAEEQRKPLPQRGEFTTTKRREVGAPKHGKEDNLPHVGGSTFAGGTGGSDTAGLGGRGGPYRLDKGWDVHQVSAEAKAEVPEHVLKAAREMAKEALRKRLEEIGMSEHDVELYRRYYDRVGRQVRQLRVILEGVQAKTKERVWLKNQTGGELDDTRLIDGLTGETNIYKKRGVEGADFAGLQEQPKRFRVVMDLSGSMYRFNGVDQRLTRSLEVAVMLMEAFDGIDPKKFHYEICGHSGDSPYLPFVSTDKPPRDEKERLKVVQQMTAHTQYCASGDNTLEGTEQAIRDIVKQPGDDYFVLVLSDANMERYGIQASKLSTILQSDPRVNAHILFIGSLGNEAEVLVRQLPRGKGFLCLDTGELPKIVQQIFLSSMQSL